MRHSAFAGADEILTRALGVATACGDLDDAHPADLVLKVIAENVARHQAEAKHYAASIARDMQCVAEGDPHPHSLASCSDSRNYDAAIASMDALREPLAAAAYAYQLAHQNGDPQ
ncbi:hypothetical protein ACWEV3_40210 [Saccharopolyspora sp. NPDC003752]